MVTVEQRASMVDFIGAHPEMNTNAFRGTEGMKKRNRLWESLASTLNRLNLGSARDAIKWRKAWTDWKAKIKTRAAEFYREQRQTGGGGGHKLEDVFTAEDLKVLALMNERSIIGTRGAEGGLPQPTPAPRLRNATDVHVTEPRQHLTEHGNVTDVHVTERRQHLTDVHLTENENSDINSSSPSSPRRSTTPHQPDPSTSRKRRPLRQTQVMEMGNETNAILADQRDMQRRALAIKEEKLQVLKAKTRREMEIKEEELQVLKTISLSLVRLQTDVSETKEILRNAFPQAVPVQHSSPLHRPSPPQSMLSSQELYAMSSSSEQSGSPRRLRRHHSDNLSSMNETDSTFCVTKRRR